MRVFFLAEMPCAFSVNGMYLGIVDGFERSTELTPHDGVFCELRPAGHVPLRFRFDEAFLFDPPDRVRLYFSDQGVAVYCYDFVRDDPSMHILWQERVSGCRLTLYVQGRLQLDIETPDGFRLLSLPWYLEESRPRAAGDFVLLESARGFALIGGDGTIKALSEGRVLECGDPFRAEIDFRDSAGHTAVCTYEKGVLSRCSIRTARPPSRATYALALFESVLIGADPAPLLAPALAEKAELLRDFLGDFREVVLTDEQDTAGLVYERKPRVFDIKKFRVELTDEKISNIVPSDA